MGKFKVPLVALLVLVLMSALIGGAWYLEEYNKQIRTVVVEQPDGQIFAVEMEEKEGATVFVQCDEDDFEPAFAKFRQFLGLENPPLSITGGPLVVARAPTEIPDDLKPAKRALVEVLKRYSPQHVILLAHSDCLLYDTIAAWENNLPEVKARQIADLRKAAAALHEWLPKAEIQLYYAEKKDGKMVFHRVRVEEDTTPIPVIQPERGTWQPPPQQPTTEEGR